MEIGNGDVKGVISLLMIVTIGIFFSFRYRTILARRADPILPICSTSKRTYHCSTMLP